MPYGFKDNAPVFENDEDHHVGQELSFTAAEKRHTGKKHKKKVSQLKANHPLANA